VEQATQSGLPLVTDAAFGPPLVSDRAVAADDAASMVSDALVLAQQVADETLAEARAEAERVRRDAHAEVGRSWSEAATALAEVHAETERARAEVDRLISTAQAEAKAIESKAHAEAERMRAEVRAEAEELDLVVEAIRSELTNLSAQLAASAQPVAPPVSAGQPLHGAESIVASLRAVSAEMVASVSQSQAPPAPGDEYAVAEGKRLSPIPLEAILPMVGIVLVLIVVLAWLG
jgi:F0F1-type ATP synthase membrane subunit b/b'